MVWSYTTIKASSYKDESYIGVCTSCTKYVGICTSGRKLKRVTPERRMTQEREPREGRFEIGKSGSQFKPTSEWLQFNIGVLLGTMHFIRVKRIVELWLWQLTNVYWLWQRKAYMDNLRILMDVLLRLKETSFCKCTIITIKPRKRLALRYRVNQSLFVILQSADWMHSSTSQWSTEGADRIFVRTSWSRLSRKVMSAKEKLRIIRSVYYLYDPKALSILLTNIWSVSVC